MSDPPGTIAPPARPPRRPPAHRSVSLRHSPPAAARGPKARVQHPTAQSSPNAASDRANPPSTLSPKLSLNKQSSGESSDAGKWFEMTNNNPKQCTVSCADNEPPFSLRNSSSADTPPDAPQYGHMHPSMPYCSTFNQLGTDASSTDDFRSVIDDLTIANKKLRQKLKKYEKLYDEHLQEEKLFEVRFHGLPEHKKKELEETLRKFAADLDDSMANPYEQVVSHMPNLEQNHITSSTSRFAESGYASMSMSGQNSSARSNPTSTQEKDNRKMSKSRYNRQQQSIQTYLHDISSGLPPRNKAPMTDKSKKKLIVRRLEQIFAGKRSAPDPHQQPLQQEEVAQSAATADRQEREATGQAARPEGLREAHIMPQEADEHMAVDAGVGQLLPLLQPLEHDFSIPGFSPDQRPTRPLDLDPSRAQISAENMDYIRHLGFTPPNMVSGEAPIDGHGWLYLNLLINMAQLHIYNVTPEFVKDAIQDYSSHLEISRDGRKVRWMGGRNITRNSGSNSSENYSSVSPDAPGSGSPQKRSTTSHTATSSETPVDAEKRARMIARAKRQSEQNKFAYKPLFFHKDDSEEDEDFYGASLDGSLQPQQATGNSSGMGSSAKQSGSSNPKREDGPIIFYTKAKFCTDLSGNRLGASVAVPGSYKAITNQPLGEASPDRRPTLTRAFTIGEPRGPMDSTPMEVDSNAESDNMSSLDGFGFSPYSLEAQSSQSGNDSPDLMDFEVSGLGGVHPEDNFSIHIRRSQVPAAPSEPHGRRRSQLYPKKILDVLAEQSSDEAQEAGSPISRQRIIKEELISATRRILPSSTLPPASFLPFDSTLSGDVDSDLDSDVSSEADSDSNSDAGEVGTTALQQLKISPITVNPPPEDEDDDDDDDDDGSLSEYSDSSVDFLATARQFDPNTVIASEREYEAAIAERWADDLPAGSSAATAGGGSGFNSPKDQKGSTNAAANAAAFIQDGNTPVEKRLSVTSSTSSRSGLKRMRTQDSVTVPGMSSAKGLKSRKIGENS